jgi:hypothetical protein
MRELALPSAILFDTDKQHELAPRSNTFSFLESLRDGVKSDRKVGCKLSNLEILEAPMRVVAAPSFMK